MNSYFKTISKPEWNYKAGTGNYEFNLSLIEKDVLLCKTIGYAYRKDVKNAEQIIQKVLDEFFPFEELFYFISDFAKVTGSSTGARNEHLNHRLQQLHRASLLIYSKPNALLKIVVKTGRLFSSQLRKKVVVSKNLEHSLKIIEQHRKNVLITSVKAHESVEFEAPTVQWNSKNADEITSNIPEDKEALKDLVIKLKKEKFEQNKIIRKKTNQLIKALGKITWGDSNETEFIDDMGKDEFSDLFDSFNLLQTDLVELITKQKKVQDELIKNGKQYQILFNNIADVVLLHDMETHCFVDCNDRALKYGYTKEELLTMTPLDIHPLKEHDKVKKRIDGLNEITGTGNRYHHVMKDGTQIDVEILTSVIEYNGRSTWVSIVRDITGRKQFENALIKKQKEAEAASQAKSDFLANMSHEIRTPMNGVIGMLDLLSETDLSEEQYEFAMTAQQSAESLLLLINDILDFSKIEAGKLDFEIIDFDLTVTLDSLSDLISIKAFEKGINFACLIENDVPLLLKGDPTRLRQILSNLTNNALKFTTEGEILIKVSLKEEIEKKVTLLFEVIDTGTGIPENKLNALFESFTQVDASTTRKYGGTGLGLAISKQLTELMAGEIEVKSELGKGSNFSFTLVFDKQEGIKQKLVLADDIKGTKILIVDDNNTNHTIFKEYLKSWDCTFDKVNNGDKAILMLTEAVKNKEPYKLALIDMQMPSMSGEKLGETIKSCSNIQDTILVMLSSTAIRGDVKKIEKAGFAGFLTKPIKKSKLFDTFRTVLSIDHHDLGKPIESIITSYKVEEIKKAQKKNHVALKILLVEDNKLNQLVVKKMLQHTSQEILVANNGKEAVDLFVKEKFDLIFMDIQMPVMDGEEATRKIRVIEKEKGTHTPIIALTANVMKGDRERFIACGVDEYLPKPLKKDNLLKVIKSFYSI